MRIKAIPAEIGQAFETHPYLLGGVAALVLVGGYMYFRAPPSQGQSADNASSQFGYSMPQVINQGRGTGIVDSVTAPLSGSGGGNVGGVTNQDLFNFEVLKESHDYTLANKALDGQLAIAATNAQTAIYGIQASTYAVELQTEASLAGDYFRSGNQFAAGNIGGLTFAFLSGGAYHGSSKNDRRASNQSFAQFTSLSSNPFIQSLLGASNNVPQPTFGGGSTPTYGVPVSSAPYGTVSSISAPPVVPAIYNGSTSQTAYIASPTSAPVVGGSWNGGASRPYARYALN